MRATLGRIRTIIRRRDEGGAVAILVAASMVMLLASSALSVDVGRLVARNRSLQSIADAASLDAATVLDGASAAQVATAVDQEALSSAERNGFVPATAGGPAGNSLSVTLGQWSWSSRTFTPVSNTDTSAVPNAVQVQPHSALNYVLIGGGATPTRIATATLDVPPGGSDQCGPGCTGSTTTTSTTCCTTTNTPPLAGFTIGSWLASFDTTQVTVLNDLLSTLSPGTQANVTAAGYQGLATTAVELGDIAAADANIGTVENLLAGSYAPKVWYGDLAKALANRAQRELSLGNSSVATNLEQTEAVVSALASKVTVTTAVSACTLVSFDPNFSCTPPSPPAGQPGPPGASASVNVLRLVTGLAEVADGSSGFDADLGIGTPVHLTTSLIHPVRVVGPSPVGTSAQTDQVDVALKLSLPLATTLTVSNSAASAQATQDTISCPANGGVVSTSYAVSTTGTTLTAAVKNGLSTYTSQDVLPGASGQLNFPVPPATTWTETDGQSVSTGAPGVSFSFSGSSTLPGAIAPVVVSTLTGLDAQLPDVLTSLGVAVAGATVTSWPVDCATPVLVSG